MERSIRDDVKVAFCYLLGAALGWLMFARDDAGMLLGSLVGVVIAFVGVSVVRYARRRRKT
jgi:hypothetical protein